MATLAALLTARAPRCIARLRHLSQQRVDAARLLRLGTKHPLAKIAVLSLGENELSLDCGEFLAQLDTLAIMAKLHPLQALEGLGMQGSILICLQLQLDVLAARDAENWVG